MSPPPRVLLLQVRSPWHQAAMLQEQVCFRELAGLGADRLHAVNLVTSPAIAWADVEPYAALFVGGAGSHTVTVEYDFTRPLAEVVRRWVGEGRPFLGSCWGHQFLAWALGGTVVTDEAHGEVGTFAVERTAAGRADHLLAGFPDRFGAHLGHHDLVAELPAGMVELARSERCRNQVVRLDGLPVYGTQFHCELTAARMRERLRMYSSEYLPADDLEGELDRLLRPTPDAETLIGRFLHLYAPDVISSRPRLPPHDRPTGERLHPIHRADP